MTDYLNMHKRPTHMYGQPAKTKPAAPAAPVTPQPPSPKDVVGVRVEKLGFEDSTRVDSPGPGEPGTRKARDGLPTGAYAFVDGDLWFVCPCGCRELSWIPVTTGQKVERSWLWNGDEAKPVVSPSILKRYGCRWHGFLGAPDGSKPGVWTTC